ncbi:hypothetical protein HaLaN_03379 [Haematococcus lacustris]|uniref:Uncharacterized protein n=1 Tax=Haematococcus lacustris TaxID=44745 RepID=A0A699YEF7_HAELA|nr:hypothetical protein HaLaN_03379 [Haematococcus lacustris]
MRAECFVLPDPAHIAADDVKAVEGLQHLLLGLLRPGVPLLGLLGGGALQRGVLTLCELLSSATMMLQALPLHL